MAVQNRVVCRTWIMRFSLATTLIVVVLSLLNAVRIPYIILRGGISFGVIYFLLTGFLCLFEKTALPKPEGVPPASDTGRGGLIDFSVGDDESQIRPPEETRLAGQVDPGLNEGMPDGERQAEAVRRMSWGDS